MATVSPIDKLKNVISTTPAKPALQSLLKPAPAPSAMSSLMNTVTQKPVSSLGVSLATPTISPQPTIQTSTPKIAAPAMQTAIAKAQSAPVSPAPLAVPPKVTQPVASAPLSAPKPLATGPVSAPQPSASAPTQQTPVAPFIQNPTPTPPPSFQAASVPEPTPTSSVDPNIAIRDALRQQLSGLANPTPEESALLSQIDAKDAEAQQLALSTRMGVSGLEGQGRAIPLALIRGQQAKLQEQGALQGEGLQLEGQTLAQKLARMQAARSLQGQSLQNQLGYVTDDITAKQAAAAALAKPIDVAAGASIARFNPTTGKYEFASAPQAAKPLGLETLSAGQTLIDPNTGKVVYQTAEKPTVEANPASYKEWQLAGSPGGPTGYGDWLQNKGQSSGRPLTASQAQLISEGNQLPQILEPLYGILQNQSNLFGPIKGSFQAQNPFAHETQKVEDDLSRAAQVVGKYMEGGVLRLEDEKKYKKMLPTLSDTPDVAKNKLDGVMAMLKQKQQQYLDDFSSAGFNTSGFSGQQGKNNGSSGDSLDAAIQSLGFKNAPSTAQKGSIVSVTIGNKPVQVSSTIKDNLAQADADFFKATGKHLQINEAERSTARQAQLYEAYKNGSGIRAAPPGQSFHEKGLAVDVGNWKEAEPYLRKYGFKNNLADDKNHFSIGEFA